METGRGLGEDHDCDRRTSSKAELVGSSFFFLSPFSSQCLLKLYSTSHFPPYPATSGSRILE